MPRLKIIVIKPLLPLLSMCIGLLFVAFLLYQKPTSAEVMKSNQAIITDHSKDPPEDHFFSSGCINDLDLALKKTSNSSNKKTTKVVIALVPDPLDSQVGWLFDGQLEAMIDAVISIDSSEANKQQFYRDKTILPWGCASQALLSIVNQPFLFSLQLQNLRYKQSIIHQKNPGLVLFRSSETTPSLIMLLLVGESPVWGIQSEAFDKALKISHNYSKTPNEYSIVGPTFSGTRSSLRKRIEDWSEKKPGEEKFTLISGSASAEENKSYLEISPNSKKKLTVTFHATVIPDKLLFEEIYNYLENELYVDINNDVAILAESDTAYGSSLTTKPDDITDKFIFSEIYNFLKKGFGIYVNDDITESNLFYVPSYLTKTDDKKTTVIPNKFLFKEICNHLKSELSININDHVVIMTEYNELPNIFRFPMQIGRTRSAVESRDINHASSSFLEKEQISSRSILNLTLDESTNAADEIPAFGARIQSVSDDMTIANLANLFSRHPFKFVGIQATDIRDKLFLIKKLKEYFPEVNLFTTQADILFTHPDFNRITKGMLIASSYRLVETNNSFLTLMDNDKKNVVSFQFPRSMAVGAYNAVLAILENHELIEYSFKEINKDLPVIDLPAIHLLGVGKTGLWPLKRISYPNKDDFTYNNKQQDHKRYTLFTSDVSLTTLSIWFVILSIYGGWRWWRNIKKFKSKKLNFCFWTLWAFLVMPFIVSFCFVNWNDYWADIINQRDTLGDKFWNLFIIRTSSVEFSGLSFLPSFAFLLIALLWLLEYAIRASQLNEFIKGNLFFLWIRNPGHEDENASALTKLKQNVEFKWFNHLLITIIFIVPILAYIYLFLVWYFPGSVTDPRSVYFIMWFLLIINFIFYALLLYRLYRIWGTFKAYLNQCSTHPLIWAFDRLPRRVSGWIEWSLFSMPSFGIKEIDTMLTQYEDLLKNHLRQLIVQSVKIASKRKRNQSHPGRLASRKEQILLMLNDPIRIRKRLEKHWRSLPVRKFLWELPISKDVHPTLGYPIAGNTPPTETLALYMLSTTHEYHVWIKLAEDYAALHVVKVIHFVLSQLWMLVKYSIWGLLFLLAAIASYDFEPNEYIDLGLFVLSVLVLGIITFLIFSINKNDVVSRILKSEPNKMTPDQSLVLQMLAYVILPVCGVIAYYMPSFSNLFGWVSAFLGGVK